MAELWKQPIEILRFVVRQSSRTRPRRSLTTLSRTPSSRVSPPCTSYSLQQQHQVRCAIVNPAPVSTPLASLSQRNFATSQYHRQAIINPRQDEDGKAMEVEITSRAANRLKQIMNTDANPDLALRVTVESGGCHGFQYLMSLTDMSQISQDEDTVFEGSEGAKVVMDQPSLELLNGSKVDYTMELIGSQFKIVDNPFASSSCGCGTSFDIKP